MPDMKSIPSYVYNEKTIVNPNDRDVEGYTLHRVMLHHLDPFGALVFAETADDAVDLTATHYKNYGWDGVFITEADIDFKSPEFEKKLYETGEYRTVGVDGERIIDNSEVNFSSYSDPLIVDSARVLAYIRSLPAMTDPRTVDNPHNLLKQMAVSLEKVLWPTT